MIALERDPAHLEGGRVLKYLAWFVLLPLSLAAAEQNPPSAVKAVKDVKGACRILVPEAWTAASENAGSAMLQDPSNAIAVVTSQPGQFFKPLSESLQKVLGIPKAKMFENSTRRIFYQDKAARNAEDTSAFSVMVAGNGGTCSARVVFVSKVPEETAKKIVLSVGPVPE
jgi:hypothetical protein